MKTREFLESKIGNYNSTHPFSEKNIDYEDIESWLEEYAKQFHLVGLCVFCDSDELYVTQGIARCNGCGQSLNYTKKPRPLTENEQLIKINKLISEESKTCELCIALNSRCSTHENKTF